MPSAIFSNKKEATKYKQYLRRQHKTNLVIHRTGDPKEVVYTIPFKERKKKK